MRVAERVRQNCVIDNTIGITKGDEEKYQN